MKKNTVIKGLTLAGFVFFIIAFLLYRTGKFDGLFTSEKSALQTSHNGGTVTTSKADSLKQKRDSAQKLRLSSSKVLILTDEKNSYSDSTKKKPANDKFRPVNAEMLSSSKSAIIFKPVQPAGFNLDILKHDTAKIKRKQ